MKPQLFQEKEWDLFIGQLVSQGGLQRRESIRTFLPSWVNSERYSDLYSLKTHLPAFFDLLDLNNASMWAQFFKSPQCEKEFPEQMSGKISKFQQLLVVQAIRPDRLQTMMERFVVKTMNMKELYPASLNFKRLYETDSLSTEPILVVISPGTDPSVEIQELADSMLGENHFHQVAMGQGQAEIAIQSLRSCASKGEWLCLKNLHLVTSWLPSLEKELNSIKPHENFRLWLTTESHPKFPAVLLQSSLKVTYEAPPGIKKNLARTYDSWSPEYIAQGDSVLYSQALFALAWFHAVLQERRCYIPQGWSKFYEFSMSDLRAGASIIDRMFHGSGETLNCTGHN